MNCKHPIKIFILNEPALMSMKNCANFLYSKIHVYCKHPMNWPCREASKENDWPPWDPRTGVIAVCHAEPEEVYPVSDRVPGGTGHSVVPCDVHHGHFPSRHPQCDHESHLYHPRRCLRLHSHIPAGSYANGTFQESTVSSLGPCACQFSVQCRLHLWLWCSWPSRAKVHRVEECGEASWISILEFVARLQICATTLVSLGSPDAEELVQIPFTYSGHQFQLAWQEFRARFRVHAWS